MSEKVSPERLQELMIEALKRCGCGDEDCPLCENFYALRELASLREGTQDAIDARRYRWLKENHLQLGPDCWIRTGDDLDDATDAALDKANQGAKV